MHAVIPHGRLHVLPNFMSKKKCIYDQFIRSFEKKNEENKTKKLRKRKKKLELYASDRSCLII